MCLDCAIIGSAACVACILLATSGNSYSWIADPWLVTTTFCGSMSVGGLVFGLYEHKTLLARSRILVRTSLTLSLGVVLAFATLSVFFYAQASRWVGVAVVLAFLGLALPLRLIAQQLISTSPVRLLCVGADASVRKLVAILGRRHSRHYQVVGHVRVPKGPLRLVAGVRAVADKPRFRTEEDLQFEESCPYVGDLDQIVSVLGDYGVDEVIVGSELAADSHVGRAVAPCLEGRCRVTDQATFIEKLLGEVPAESVSAEWFLRADVQNRGNYESISRVLDVAVALFGLLVTLPLWPLIVALIRLNSRGAAIFKQMRVGQHGRYFRMYKFRTMRADAEKNGVRWAVEKDNRVTWVGRFLRKSRIDEWPQFLNILRGDMSLVGPRPERPEFVHNLEEVLPHYRLRHLVRPGLTGWAQIHYRYGASVADAHRKLCYDLYYLKHRSLELDVAILIRTLGTFVLGAR